MGRGRAAGGARRPAANRRGRRLSRPRRAVAPTLAALSFALATGFAAMAVPAGRLYSSAGIDREVSDGAGGAWNTHWRVQWPGDGTVRFGGSGWHERVRTYPFEPFDLGGVFFRPPGWEGPRRPPGGPFYRVGFRRPDAWASFVGAPAWFPAALFAAPPLLWLCARRWGRQSPAA